MGNLEQYEVLKLLGKGSFGSVYCVRRTQDRSLHVMKKISVHNMPAKERKTTEQECKVLQRLRHPGIVCYEDSFVHKNRQLCIVMSFCEGGDLSSMIEKRRMRYFKESEVISWFLQISLALQYMHQERILHRDLKTQNIFLTKSGQVKLGDFGIAKVLEGTLEMAKTVIGTPYYMSPELFRNQPYSFKSDIWSLGCVLFELVALRHAFEARDMNGLVQKIVRGSHAAIPAAAGKDMRALINSMLALAPGQRPTVTEILRMPFIRKEMSLYIQQQLGDSVAAELLRDDPKLAGFMQQEQDQLEAQAKKLGIDVSAVKPKSNSLDERKASDLAPKPPAPSGEPRSERRPLAAPPGVPKDEKKAKGDSLPNAAEAEKLRVAEQEKERQKRAKAFLERELKAKERAEAALKQLQREKAERIRVMAEQKELRNRRMGVAPPSARGGDNPHVDWQRRLDAAQQMHAQRRKEQGMVAGGGGGGGGGEHRPRPPPKSRLEDHGAAQEGARAAAVNIIAAAHAQQGGGGGKRSVLEERNAAARVAADPNNNGNNNNVARRRSEGEGSDKENADEKLVGRGNMREENERLRSEMNKDMQIMEVKLSELRRKKEEDDRRKRAQGIQRPSAPPSAQPGQGQRPSAPPTAQGQGRPSGPGGQGGGGHHQNPGQQQQGQAPGQGQGRQQHPPQHANNANAPAPHPQRNISPPLQHAPGGGAPHPPRASATPRFADQGAIRYHAESNAVRHSEPAMSNYLHGQHPSAANHNRLQAVPAGGGSQWGEVPEELEHLSGDLIARQKELDRQPRQKQPEGVKEFSFQVERIHKAVGQSISARPMVLQGEVGARISERDRELRKRQQHDVRRARYGQGQGGGGSYNNGDATPRGYSNVAYEGNLYSPAKSQQGGFLGEIDEELGMRVGEEEEEDERCLYYAREEENLQEEVARRTLKIQMVKTALIGNFDQLEY